MVTIQEAEKTILARLSPGEKIEKYVCGSYSNCSKRSAIQLNDLLIATSQRIFHLTTAHLIEYPYHVIDAIYYRNKIISGQETIFFSNGIKHSFSAIEEGNPLDFMSYVHKKIHN